LRIARIDHHHGSFRSAQDSLLDCPYAHGDTDKQGADVVPIDCGHLVKVTDRELNDIAGILWLIKKPWIAGNVIDSPQLVLNDKSVCAEL
jgi:hypothetical protein